MGPLEGLPLQVLGSPLDPLQDLSLPALGTPLDPLQDLSLQALGSPLGPVALLLLRKKLRESLVDGGRAAEDAAQDLPRRGLAPRGVAEAQQQRVRPRGPQQQHLHRDLHVRGVVTRRRVLKGKQEREGVETERR